MDEKLITALASALQMTATEFTAALKDGDNLPEGDALTDKVKEVAAARLKAAKEQQYTRGKNEVAKSVGRWAKERGVSFEGEKVEDILEAATEAFEQKAATPPEGNDPSKFSREDLLKLPVVKELLQGARQEAVKPFEAQKETYEAALKKERLARVADIAKREAAEFLEAENIILEIPEMGIKKAERLKAIYSNIDFNSLGTDDKGNIIVLDEDGKPKTDDFGKPVEYKSIVVDTAKPMFGVRSQNPNNGGANPGTGASGAQGQGAAYKPTYTFASQADYEKALSGENDNAKRATMGRDYLLQQQQQKAAG